MNILLYNCMLHISPCALGDHNYNNKIITYATVSVLCIVVQYLLYIVVLYHNQCTSHNISPYHLHNTCTVVQPQWVDYS